MTDKSSLTLSAYQSSPYKSGPSTTDANPVVPPTKLTREHSDHLLSYYESSIPNQGRHHARPTSPQKTTARPKNRTRKVSVASTSSSDYSYDSEVTDAKGAASEASSGVARRPGTPSKGGADRRRVAIVQMDSHGEGTHKSGSDIPSTSKSIRSRRGIKSNLTGLALVAPPDAAPRSYSQLTPPPTAPASSASITKTPLVTREKGHHRSMSESGPIKIPSGESPRNVQTAKPPAKQPVHSDHSRPKRSANKDRHVDAILQGTAHSRTPSPTHSAKSDRPGHGRGLHSPLNSSYPPMNTASTLSPILTPKIGEGKAIHVPVAGPVVVNLDSSRGKSSSSLSRTDSPTPSAVTNIRSSATSHRRHQSAAQAVTGQSTPPPQATFNINVHSPPPPRPPRLNSPPPTAMKGEPDSDMQPPPSVSAVLNSHPLHLPETTPLHTHHKDRDDGARPRTTDCNLPLPNTGHSSDAESTTSNHRREGAFLASQSEGSPIKVTKSNEDEKRPEPASLELGVGPDDVPNVTVVTPPPNTAQGQPDVQRFDQWLNQHPEFTNPSDVKRSLSLDKARNHIRASKRSLSPLSPENTGDVPSPPPKSFRNSLTSMKRFPSLSRTPPLSSRSGRPSSASNRSSRTPSPSTQRVVPPPQKIRSTNPAALFCHEVYTQRTTAERCLIYASKINELYLYDCGLSDWVMDMKCRGPNTQTQHAPSSISFTPQPRHTSRSSIISEATFPRRPDATAATDLLQGAYEDINSSIVPATLPYPSLALNPPHSYPARSNSSVGSGTPPSSVRSLTPLMPSMGGGFFASLGRKASLSSSGRGRPGAPLSASGSVSGSEKPASKNSPPTMHISRPIQIVNPPSIPGGPRAPPQRPQRSKTFTTSLSPSSTQERQAALGRRPSLFNFSLDTVIDIQAKDPDFAHQVDKLSALIPHADRNVLAGYLQHAGQDMLAIGQYLEDQRMNTIRQFKLEHS